MIECKYTFWSSGKLLREYIEKSQTIDDIILIYNQMITCLENLKALLNNEDREVMEHEIDRIIKDLQREIPDPYDEELFYSNEVENINYYLNEFYNLCDDFKVLI